MGARRRAGAARPDRTSGGPIGAMAGLLGGTRAVPWLVGRRPSRVRRTSGRCRRRGRCARDLSTRPELGTGGAVRRVPVDRLGASEGRGFLPLTSMAGGRRLDPMQRPVAMILLLLGSGPMTREEIIEALR